MKQYSGYLIDLDGTTYYGKRRIPTAELFIQELLARDIPFKFLTNNATRQIHQIQQMLEQDYDLPVKDSHIYTSIIAMVNYLQHHHPNAELFVIGEEPLKTELRQAGFTISQDRSADVVVQALNRQTNYEELAMATQAILNGATFLVTNTDQLIPTADGLYPSSGATTAFLKHATSIEPIVMGKPHAPIIEGALEQLGLPKDEVLMIGDNYQTDIQVGIQNGVDTLLVLTGVTQKEEVPHLPVPPTYVVDNLSQWMDKI